MSNTYITIVDGEYKKAKAPDVPQPWKPTMPEAPSGGGLPDPSSYEDGTVLIKVSGEWKAQAGYGWENEAAFEPITWDGNTEGRENIGGVLYKVSDDPVSADDIIGCVVSIINSGVTANVTVSEVTTISDDAYAFESYLLVALEDTEVSDAPVTRGVYFSTIGAQYTSKLTAPSSVTTIDPKFIRSVIPAAPAEDGEYVLSCTISSGEATYSWESATAE